MKIFCRAVFCTVILAVLLVGCGGVKEAGAPQQLSVDDVLCWKKPYAEYLGKNVYIVLNSFGKPDAERTVKTYSYLEYRVKDTSKVVGFSYLTARPVVRNIYISSEKNETLDINKVLVQTEMFSLYSGKYIDSIEKYFNAQDQDGNVLQFTVNQSSLTFHRLIIGKENFGTRGLCQLAD